MPPHRQRPVRAGPVTAESVSARHRGRRNTCLRLVHLTESCQEDLAEQRGIVPGNLLARRLGRDVGAHAGELLGEVSLAMQHNLRLSDILNTIHAYPTMNTGIQQAVFEAYLEGRVIATNRKLVRALTRFRR